MFCYPIDRSVTNKTISGQHIGNIKDLPLPSYHASAPDDYEWTAYIFGSNDDTALSKVIAKDIAPCNMLNFLQDAH